MDFIKEFGAFLLTRKKYWLIPLMLLLFLLSLLIVCTGGTALAPFVYTLF